MADSNNFRVGEYRIGFSQRPNVPRQSNQAERFISLWPDPSYAGAKQSASLLFFVNLTVGVGLNQATQLIVAFPYEDFEPVCQMLRAEDDCYLVWSSDDPPSLNTKLTSCQLLSGQASPGEGP